MATKKTKKKSEKEVIVEVSNVWPKVNIGSHLTVIEYEDGKTELIWDDEALARDVREALKNA
jgi:hypothetical protein